MGLACLIVVTSFFLIDLKADTAKAVVVPSTWASVFTTPPSSNAINGTYCVNSNFCVAVGDSANFGVAYTSTDGGTNWTVENSPATVTYLQGVSCSTVNFCVAVGGSNNAGAIMYSTDGGTNWTQATIPSGSTAIYSVSCSSSTFCVAIGSSASSGWYYDSFGCISLKVDEKKRSNYY